jgi:hypothetical protein
MRGKCLRQRKGREVVIMDVLAKKEGERGTISNDRKKWGLLSYSCSMAWRDQEEG